MGVAASAAATDSGGAAAALARVETALAADRPRAAREGAERCIDHAPQRSACHEALGHALSLALLHGAGLTGLRHALRARGAYRRAIELDPGNLAARLALLRYHRQAPWIAGGRPERADAQARAMARIDPALGETARGVNAYFDGDVEVALAHFERAVTIDPRPALWDPYYYLVMTAAELGRHGLGLRTVAALLGHRGEAWRDWLPLGYGNLEERFSTTLDAARLKAAAGALDADARLCAMYAYARVLERLGARPAAAVGYRAVLELDPDFARARRALESLPK